MPSGCDELNFPLTLVDFEQKTVLYGLLTNFDK